MDTENGSANASDYLANEYFPLFRYHWYPPSPEQIEFSHAAETVITHK